MDQATLTQIMRAVADHVTRSPMRAYFVRQRIYRNLCCVLDCKCDELAFGFDIVPVSGDLCAVDIVPRKGASVQIEGVKFVSKSRILDAVPLPEALAVIERAVSDIADQQINAHPGPSDKPTAKDALTVGVITLPISTNYGNNLQAFATVETLRRMGHKPILINRRRGPKNVLETDADIAAAAARPAIADGITLEPKSAENARFIDTHVGSVSSVYTSSRQLQQNIGRFDFDAIITGSDQVWRPRYTREMLHDFFLGFLPPDSPVRRISYAASFGADNWEYRGGESRRVAELLARFDGVSVREDSAAHMCQTHLGREAVHVLDPTLLLPRERYVSLFKERIAVPPKEGIVTYLLDPADDKTALLNRLSETLGLPVQDTSGLPYDGGNPLRGKGDKSIEHWLASIHGARYVVTDSFHGMVFAILFQRPFLVYANPGRGMARFTSMLKLLELESRLVLRAADMTLERSLEPIDWSAVETRLDHMRDISLGFLRKALTGDPRPPSPDGNAHHAPAPTSAPPQVLQPGAATVHPLGVQCTGCGTCVSESCGSLRMGWTEDGFRQPFAISPTVPPETLRVCPFNPDPDAEVADEDAIGKLLFSDARQHHPDAGYYERAYIGYSTEFRPNSSSGGIATYVFDRLLRFGIVDHLFVVRASSDGAYSYALFDSTEDIRTISKTRYFPVSMEELFERIDQMPGRVALSGVACFVKAVRLKQHYHPRLKEKIPFVVGIICGGLKSRLYSDFLASSAGAGATWHNAEYRQKNPDSIASDYSFSVSDAENTRHQVRMKSLGDMWGSGLFKSKACDFCTDVLTELADLSVGDAWLPDYVRDGNGNSVMVARSRVADTLIQAGMDSGDLDAVEKPVSLIVKSQQGGLDHKQKGVKFRSFIATLDTDIPVPHVRPRVLTELSAGNMMVQILRERVRAKSIVYWHETGDAKLFLRRMAASRRLLLSLSKTRKNNDRQITELARAALDQPQNLPKTELTPVRILLRWLRRKVAVGDLSANTLDSLLNTRQSSSHNLIGSFIGLYGSRTVQKPVRQ